MTDPEAWAFADTEPDLGWVAWLVDLEEEYHARVILVAGNEGKAQAYLFPLPKEH